MAKDVEMLGVMVAPAQKAKVKRWAAEAGVDMSTVIRTLIDGVELEIKPTFTVKRADDRPTVTLHR